MITAAPQTWPWRPAHLVALYLCNLIGAMVLFTSWLETSGSVSLHGQVPWLDAGIAGVIVAAVGNLIWLLAGRRNVGVLRRHLTLVLDAVGTDEP